MPYHGLSRPWKKAAVSSTEGVQLMSSSLPRPLSWHLLGLQADILLMRFLEVAFALNALCWTQGQGIICFLLGPGVSLGDVTTWEQVVPDPGHVVESTGLCYQETRINMLLC